MKLLVFVVCLLGAANAQVRWQPARDGNIPAGTIRGGQEQGQALFVCRGNVLNNVIAGKLDASLGSCLIAHADRVIHMTSYDAATGGHSWRPYVFGDVIPNNAALVGFTVERDRTFACRARHMTDVIPGKLLRQLCYFAIQDREVFNSISDILLNA